MNTSMRQIILENTSMSQVTNSNFTHFTLLNTLNFTELSFIELFDSPQSSKSMSLVIMLAAEVKLNKHDINTIEYLNKELIINQNLFNFLFF